MEQSITGQYFDEVELISTSLEILQTSENDDKT